MNKLDDFEPGLQVLIFESVQKNKWTKPELRVDVGEVVDVQGGKVWVDTNFGPVPFLPNELEFADAPF